MAVRLLEKGPRCPAYFRALSELRDELKTLKVPKSIKRVSMGMTH